LLAIPLVIIPLWKIYQKCGKPGWAAIIPVYSTWVLFEITGFPAWWALLSIIPFVSIFPAIVSLVATVRLAKIFGKGTGFGIGMIFLPFIFLPILGYGDAQPVDGAGKGPVGPAGTPPNNPNTDGQFNPVSQQGGAPQPPQAPLPPAPVAPQAPEQPGSTNQDNQNQSQQPPVV
jgi:hypothetical protein